MAKTVGEGTAEKVPQRRVKTRALTVQDLREVPRPTVQSTFSHLGGQNAFERTLEKSPLNLNYLM
jgi:hypothetical protein